MSMKRLIIVERGDNNYSAYVPDLPGCVATGQSADEVTQLLDEAIEFHIDGMKAEGLPIPEVWTKFSSERES